MEFLRLLYKNKALKEVMFMEYKRWEKIGAGLTIQEKEEKCVEMFLGQ